MLIEYYNDKVEGHSVTYPIRPVRHLPDLTPVRDGSGIPACTGRPHTPMVTPHHALTARIRTDSSGGCWL